jgi:hypothetical protein
MRKCRRKKYSTLTSPEASSFPSGENANVETIPVFPSKTTVSDIVLPSHSFKWTLQSCRVLFDQHYKMKSMGIAHLASNSNGRSRSSNYTRSKLGSLLENLLVGAEAFNGANLGYEYSGVSCYRKGFGLRCGWS